MKKYFAFLLTLVAVAGCAEHDPILPGTRVDIFDVARVRVENIDVPQLSNDAKNISGDAKCEYTQDLSNNIFIGDKKIFSGFPVTNVVRSNQSPICDGGFVYTGLTTGEVIKINASNNRVVWVTDVFRASTMTGGTPVVDIVAHVGVDKDFVYAGGLGDAFCKLNKYSGEKIWCLDISVPVDFIMVDNFIFVVGGNDTLYAVNATSGKIYWATSVGVQVRPKYENNSLTVGGKRINYHNGKVEG